MVLEKLKGQQQTSRSLVDVQEVFQQISQINRQVTLTLDNPQSVKLQVKQINLAQKHLRALKKEINVAIREINQQASQSGADSLVSVGLDIFGKNKWAGRVRAETRRATERQKKASRQPYLEIKDLLDKLILKGDQMKLLAQEYLLKQG
jgi:hypothetical protein